MVAGEGPISDGVPEALDDASTGVTKPYRKAKK